MTAERIYWDSCTFLGWFQEEPGKVELCKGTINRAQDGDVLIVTSALTIAEVLWLKGGPKLAQEKLIVLRKFFRRSFIRVVNVTRTVSEDAQDIVWNNNIRPKDAIHVATALNLKIGVIETFDDHLLRQAGTIGSPPLIIRKPIPPKQGDLGLELPK